ncbi:MAG: hypothetical protein NPIRA02_16950 [Nitrospirales bacterium]|nr:MAG: hypothetical protein NPIRA02_16950 [Nitrospirales bacterium]
MLKRKSLQGIEGIYVVVEDLGTELKGTVTRRDIRSRVEAQLGTAGIRIVKEKEAAKLPGEPYLYINLAALPLERKRFACRIDVEMHQHVALIHDSKGGHAITWEQGVLTVGGLETISQQLDELVFTFICDYLAVNPMR